MKLFGSSIHPIDIAFLAVIWTGWREHRKDEKASSAIDYSVGKPLGHFLAFTLVLTVYSVHLGFGLNNSIRFALGIFYFALYYFIPVLITTRAQFGVFTRRIIFFTAVTYCIVLFQNLSGWHPSSATDQTSMSYTVDMGGVFRTYNPAQQWIVGAGSFVLAWVFGYRASARGIALLVLLIAYVLLSFARNVFIGFLVVVVFLVLYRLFTSEGLKAKLRTVVVVMLSLFFLGVIFSNLPVITERFESTSVELMEESGTFAHRLNMLRVAQVLVENPWLGGGFGVYEVEDVLGSSEEFLIASLSAGSDSGLVTLFFRFGVIGVALFAFLSYRFLRVNLGRLRKIGHHADGAIVLGSCVYTIWIWVQSIASNTFFYVPYLAVLATVWGVADTAWKLHASEFPREAAGIRITQNEHS